MPTRTLVASMIAVTLGCTACVGGAAPPPDTRSAEAALGTTVEWPVTRCGTYRGTGCAPTEARIDVTRPTFSNPTQITNPLFPISALNSVVLLGRVEGKPFRAETTLIPGDHAVIIDGAPVNVVVSQYTAYLDGRITENAVDRYAQADDGSVWYLGEDVYDYKDGTISVTEGSWLAGRDGPPAMIMPGKPKVGDVFRAENITGVVFEELTVTAVDNTVDGPRGPVNGAVVMNELHLDGSVSDKVFAPSYGEFDTSAGGDIETLALALPADRISEPVPAELRLVSTSAFGILENVRLGDWPAANSTLERLATLWRGLAGRHYPPRGVTTMDGALSALTTGSAGKDAAGVAQAALDVAQAALDLELLHRGEVEADRFHLHAQQLRVCADANDPAGVAAETATLE